MKFYIYIYIYIYSILFQVRDEQLFDYIEKDEFNFGQNLSTNLVVANGYNSHQNNLYDYIFLKSNRLLACFFLFLTCMFKFCANWILFTIRPINIFLMHNFRLQKLEI